MRQTKQKDILEKSVQKKTTFFTAEEFFQEIKEEKRKIGIATVYRFLKEKAKKNELHTYTCNRRTLFSNEKRTHAHFFCEQCKTEKHMSIKNVDFLQSEITGEICHFQLDVTGICESCLKKK